MIKLGNQSTYNFEAIHIPRIYIHDVKQVRESLELLRQKGMLTNREMAEETARVRSEDIREILYLLWKLGFGINVTKKGREIAFLGNEKLHTVLERNDNELKKLVLERLRVYNPFIAILDKLIDYRKQSLKFSEKDIAKDFHNGRDDGGRIDNTHPLLRWCKDEGWGLVVDKEITAKGIAYVNEAKAQNIVYVHHTVDLKASPELNVLTHIISDNSFTKERKIISFEDLLGLIENINELVIDKKELILNLEELIKIGLPIKLNDSGIEIKSKVYHDLTPQYYVRFKVYLIDGIDEIEVKDTETEKILTEKEVLKEYSDVNNLIVHDEEINNTRYPSHAKRISYNEFLRINSILPVLKIKNIILPPGWKPLKVSKISGILLAFVRSGGNLLIFHAPAGRIGSNRNLFNWLPSDLERISFVHSSSAALEGYFTFPFSEKFTFTSKGNYEEVAKNTKKYSILFTQYNQGLVVFVGFHPSQHFFHKYIDSLKTNPQIHPKSKVWIYRYIPSINRINAVNTEYDLYPLLKEIMVRNFDIRFDPKITGKAGQTDLFIENPFFCCCEVTPPHSNATGFSKVSEVEGHRRTMIYKGKKRFGENNVGACVFGPSFTIEAGEDKAGAVDMANATNVSLISYRDLYELVCLSEKRKLSRSDLAKIFFNEDKKAEAAIKIYDFVRVSK